MLPSAIDGEELRIPPTPRLRPRKAKVMQEFYPLPPPLASAETETEMEEEMGERVVPVPVRRGGCRKRRVGLGELAW